MDFRDPPHTQGCRDLIEGTRGHPEKVVACLGDIVKGLRFALGMRSGQGRAGQGRHRGRVPWEG
jgi:hypothetical protein